MSPAESPWTLVFLSLILAALLIGAALRDSSRTLAVIGGICLMVGIGAVVVDLAIETPRERVTRRIAGVVAAFERGDAAELLEYFSQRRACERALAEFAVANVTVEQPLSLHIGEVALQNEDSIAVTTFRVNGTVTVRGTSAGHQASQWKVTWRLEGGEYRIERIQELDPLRNEPTDRLARIGATLCP